MIVESIDLVYLDKSEAKSKTNHKEDTMMKIDETILSKLTEEQKKNVETAQTPEELLAIAKETGYELSPEELEAISGGWCPHCRIDNHFIN